MLPLKALPTRTGFLNKYLEKHQDGQVVIGGRIKKNYTEISKNVKIVYDWFLNCQPHSRHYWCIFALKKVLIYYLVWPIKLKKPTFQNVLWLTGRLVATRVRALILQKELHRLLRDNWAQNWAALIFSHLTGIFYWCERGCNSVVECSLCMRKARSSILRNSKHEV